MRQSSPIRSTRGFRVQCIEGNVSTLVECHGKLTTENAPLLKSEVNRADLLNAYREVRRGRRMPDGEADPLIGVLRLSGITRVENGRLRVRNRI